MGNPHILTTERGHDMAGANMWSGSRRNNQAPQSAISPGGVPANPFSRTYERSNEETRTTAERPPLGNHRASLDVEGFKNLLMTGRPGPLRTGQPPQATNTPTAINGPQFESSSSTDTSSISRQSLFEPAHEPSLESPRTSYEMAESDENNKIEVVPEVKKGKKKPPPAPKHRHGKPVTPRQPQTVAFESFSATEPAPPFITRSRDNSDASKPLPLTPISPAPLHISTQDTTQQPIPIQQNSSELVAAPDAPRPRKKTPPPVPLARRQSQLRTSTVENRSRSNSALTISSQHSVEAPFPSPVPSSKDPLSVANTSSANSSSTELPYRSNSVRRALGATSSRRSTMESEPGSPIPGTQRTPSITSNRPASRTVSGEDSGNTMPPPPPPPRRRQSNRSSLDQPRPNIPISSPTESRGASTENRRTSIDSKRRTSIASESSLRHEYASVDAKGQNEYALNSPNEHSEANLAASAASQGSEPNTNILDDMEKFQREIEELRQRYSKAG
ncbi:hypothetical protein GQ44DRAFT_127701 [Phaeosphaeriaceae sp. PMI808]|nr:hypothetical protein GQ44DRAFT_127701 [Phaeosphaeriaceae sp. PMI808]